MEFVASLPPDLAALADPAARAAAPPLRPSDQDDTDAAAAVPFELLLGLLGSPLPAGESLPAAGNALPATAVTAACDSTAPTGAVAKPVTPSTLTAASGADLLARLKLFAAPAANDGSPPSPPPADGVTTDAALPFADLDLASVPDAGVAKPAAVAAPAAAPSEKPLSPDPAVAAALEAALPQTAAKDAAPKLPRAGQVRAGDPVVRSAVPTDLRAAQTPAAPVPAPIADVSEAAAARSMHRDATPETFVLPDTPASNDIGPLPTNAPAALAPTQPHGPTAPAPTIDASALAGHGAAIDTRADNWHEALASRVQVLVDQHVGEAHIKLNPPELGSVDIKISLVDDKTFVQLTAGNSAARDELTQSLPKLRELLSAGGLSLGGASVHGGSVGTGGHAAAPRIAVPGYGPLAVADSDEPEAVRPALRAAGRIDLFA